MPISIVLVEPREAGNVGAAARAMKNFALRDLAIVGEHPELLPVAGWWASGADDVLAAARFHPTLHDAVAGSNLVVATTSSRGRSRQPDLTPDGLAVLVASLDPGQNVALVFGREDHGLSAEELSLAHRTATIPTSAGFPTMNLAQSVGIFSFALATRGQVPSDREEAKRRLAPAALMERLHERLEALMVESGFLKPENPDRIYRELREWISRLQLDAREAEVLLGAVRQLEWRINNQ